MPTSTIVSFAIWTVLALLGFAGLGIFFGFLFGMAVAMFVFPVVMVFKKLAPDAAQAYYDTFGTQYALVAPIYVLLATGVVLLFWGYMRYGNDGGGVGRMNLGVNFAGLSTVLLISADMLDKHGFGN